MSDNSLYECLRVTKSDDGWRVQDFVAKTDITVRALDTDAQTKINLLMMADDDDWVEGVGYRYSDYIFYISRVHL